QGIEFRAPLQTSAPLARVIARLRQDVLTLGEDRTLAPDIETAALLVANSDIAAATGITLPQLSETP
ncbi:MAG: histidine ammonia-lyase, partial [Albidovulum sp.]